MFASPDLISWAATFWGGAKAINYTVQTGDTLSSIATGLATAITADTDMQALGVNASTNGAVLSIKSTSSNITTYAQSTSVGATETISIHGCQDHPISASSNYKTFRFDTLMVKNELHSSDVTLH